MSEITIKEFKKAVKLLKKHNRKPDKNGMIELTIEEAQALYRYLYDSVLERYERITSRTARKQ